MEPALNAPNQLRRLPAVDTLLREPYVEPVINDLSRPLVVAALRDLLDELRTAVRQGAPVPDGARLRQLVTDALRRLSRRHFIPVINATGVVLHTNLGRAPLSPEAAEAVVRMSRSYTNLEYDLERGERGERHDHCEQLLCQLTGAEAAMVVNNNAAAVLLALTALAKGRQVILSRGELIEIGGSFRVPEVMAASGCTLVEVGTTNRTHLKDYEGAITESTAAILKVHQSNYKIVGFTKAVPGAELSALARARGLLYLVDLGSGVFLDTTRIGLTHEPTVQETVASGADLVTFSGDKLLGGPQAGILVGRAAVIQACKRHPLARALRVDKMTLAAMQVTLLQYLKGEAETAVPIWQMMGQTAAELKNRSEALLNHLLRAGFAHTDVCVIPGESAVGGGSLPGEALPTHLIAVTPRADSAGRLAERLRQADPPVVVRVEDGRVLIDLRTVQPHEEPELVRALTAAVKGGAPPCT